MSTHIQRIIRRFQVPVMASLLALFLGAAQAQVGELKPVKYFLERFGETEDSSYLITATLRCSALYAYVAAKFQQSGNEETYARFLNSSNRFARLAALTDHQLYFERAGKPKDEEIDATIQRLVRTSVKAMAVMYAEEGLKNQARTGNSVMGHAVMESDLNNCKLISESLK